MFKTGRRVGVYIDGKMIVARFNRRVEGRKVEVVQDDGTTHIINPKLCRVVKEGVF